MKRAAILAAAIALVLSLAACGNKDNKNNGTNGNGTTNNETNGGGTNNNSAGSGSMNNGTGTGNNSTGNNAAGNDNTGSGIGRSIGNGVRNAVDDMGRAVDDLMDGGRDSRAANMSSFQRMLENARVHDTDGILTDGENSRW